MSDINCPGCGHHIDEHDWEGRGACYQAPSDIARALLTAEPTEAEVEAAERARYEAKARPRGSVHLSDDDWATLRSTTETEAMRAALRAAAKARR